MDRLEFIKKIALATAAGSLTSFPGLTSLKADNLITKTIPSSGVELPVIGMGTWLTFDVGTNKRLKDHRTTILEEFFARGGGLIDSSPMYGSSEAVVGYGLEQLGYPADLFSATKVWTSSTREGKAQIRRSKELWGVHTLDLEQVHNLINWQNHLETLFRMKEQGSVRHVGVTTYGGYRHGELANIMKSQPIDCIQLTYNVENRKAEERILGLAQELDIAVIANRPFGGGSLIDRMQRHPLPPWLDEVDCRNWPQLLLKFIVSHPAVHCAIPATTQVEHMKENMGACHGKLLAESDRQRLLDYIADL